MMMMMMMLLAAGAWRELFKKSNCEQSCFFFCFFLISMQVCAGRSLNWTLSITVCRKQKKNHGRLLVADWSVAYKPFHLSWPRGYRPNWTETEWNSCSGTLKLQLQRPCEPFWGIFLIHFMLFFMNLHLKIMSGSSNREINHQVLIVRLQDWCWTFSATVFSAPADLIGRGKLSASLLLFKGLALSFYIVWKKKLFILPSTGFVAVLTCAFLM